MRSKYDDFWFFKMAVAAILDFSNFRFLTVRTVKRVEMRHCAKFRRNRSNRGRDMAIFRFFKMAADAILICDVRVVWAFMRVWPVCEFLKRYKNDFRYFTYVSRCRPWTDVHLIWHSCRDRRHNCLWQTFWWSVEGCRFCRGSNLPFAIDKASRR